MSDRVKFDIVCPNNHNQTVSFGPEEFDAALKSDALVFHCNTCDTNWPPSSEEIAKLRKHFSKDSSLGSSASRGQSATSLASTIRHWL